MPNGTYGIGAEIDIRISFYRPDGGYINMGHSSSGSIPDRYGPLNHTYLALNIPGRSAEFHSKPSPHVLVYRYVVEPGDSAADLGYNGPRALHAPRLLTELTWRSGFCYLPDSGTAGSLRFESDVSVDGIVPRVLNVTTGTPGGTYGAGSRINITVNFDEPVAYSGAAPRLRVASGGDGGGTAVYSSGNGTNALNFTYTVRGGDGTTSLDYAGREALSTGGGMLADIAGNSANLTLPAPGANGSLVAPGGIAIDTSATTAYATVVDSPDADGVRAAGTAVNITVAFTRAVVVDGEPRLLLATSPPGHARYAGGNGTAELEFRYEVRPGDLAADLDYANASALVLAGGAAIRNPADNTAASAVLYHPGDPGSLGHTKNIEIDGVPPSVLRVSSPNQNGTYGTGRIVGIAVQFTEPVTVGGEPATLGLGTAPPRIASYAGGNGTAALEFLYAVRPGDSAADLDYTAASAVLFLDGLAIRDAAGNAAAEPVRLPLPGLSGSLADSKDIGVHGAALPVIAAADSASDEEDGFDELGGANGVAAFAMGNHTFAIVASEVDNGVQTIRVHENGTLEAADSLGDEYAGDLELAGARSVDTLRTANGTTLAVVASYDDNGFQLVRVHENGTLRPAGSLDSMGDGLPLRGARSVDAFRTAGGATFALVASYANSSVQLIRIHDNGTLEAAGSLAEAGDASLALDGAGDVSAFRTANGTTLALVASYLDDGVQLVRVYDNGTLAAVDSTDRDRPGLGSLAGAAFVSTLRASDGSNSTLAMVTPRDRSHAQLLRVHDNGTIEAEGSASDGQDGFERLGRAQASDFFEMGGRTYSAVASWNDNGVQLIRVHENGELEAAGSATDGQGGEDGFAELARARGLDAFKMGNRTYAIVASVADNGVQLIRLSPASVTNVLSPLPDDTYPAGYVIRVAVVFDEPVSVSGPPPSLALALGGDRYREAGYLSGSGTRSLEFAYTVRLSDDEGVLDYAGAGALTTLGIVEDMRAVSSGSSGGGSTAADLELPAPGPPGSPGSLRIRGQVTLLFCLDFVTCLLLSALGRGRA